MGGEAKVNGRLFEVLIRVKQCFKTAVTSQSKFGGKWKKKAKWLKKK